MEGDIDRGGGECLSEGSEPVVDPRITKLCFDDSGNASLNARRLLDGKYGEKSKIEVIRPGHFVPGPIRDTGLKRPLLIKGDRYNFNPQMGVAFLDTGLTAAELEDRMDTEKQVETWDAARQRPGPQWKLGQFTTYWHARKEYVAQQALQEAKQQTVAAGQFGGDPAGADDEDLEDDGNSGQILVLQRQGGPPRAAMLVAPQVGIAPEQAMKLYCGDYLSMDAPQRPQQDPGSAPKPLADEIHPPPTILSLDLVRLLERHLGRDGKADGAHDRANELCSNAAKGGADRVLEQRSSQVGDKGGEQQAPEGAVEKPRVVGGRLAGVPSIGPAKTIHLQMTPVGCFTDFRAAPGGAATWLCVLTGRKVLALLPPTARNRSLYMAWAQASQAQTSKSQVLDVFLADYAEDAMRVEVKQNEALLIPSGWFYASVATQDCIAVCCFFWHPYALGDVARTQHLQQHLRQRDTELCRKARQLMWCAALHYARNLRDRMGLPAYRPSRPGGSARTTPSNSQGSGLQQPMRSPRGRMLGMGSSAGGAPAAAAASGSLGSNSGRRTPRGTPPGTLQQQYAGDNTLLSPAQSPSARRQGVKRPRGDTMDTLRLPESAIPLSGAAAAAAAAAAAGGGSRTPRATSSAAAAAALNAPTGHKKLKISISAGGGACTPRSVSKGGSIHQQPQQQHSGDTHSTGAAGVYQRAPQQQTSSGTPRARAQGRTPRYSQRHHDSKCWSYPNDARGDDDEEGDCQTSPVRHPAADVYVDMFDAQHTSEGAATEPGAAAAGYGGQQQDGSRAHMYMSPVTMPADGGLDLVPPLNMGAAALQQLPAAPAAPTAAAAGCVAPAPGVAAAQHQQAVGAAAGTAAAAAGGGGGSATPRKKLTLKMWPKTPSTSTAAGAAAPSTSGATGAAGPSPAAVAAAAAAAGSDGIAGAVVETTGGGSSSPHARSGDTGGTRGVTAVSRRSTPEESCCRNGSQQQGSGSNEASQQQQQVGMGSQQQQLWQQQRRVSDSANSRLLQAPAAAGGRSNITKIRFKAPTPSPQLAPSTATAAAEAAMPALQLGQALAPLQQQQQQQFVPPAAQALAPDEQQHQAGQQRQQQTVPPLPLSSIPQLDGSGDMVWEQPAAAAHTAKALAMQHQHQYIMQPSPPQQQCCLWARWQQLQVEHQQKQRQPHSMQPGWLHLGLAGAAVAAGRCRGGGFIPQCDGAGDEGGPHDTHGPMLMLQPAPACNGDMQQQQQQFQAAQQQQQHGQQQRMQAQKPLQQLRQGVVPRNGTTDSLLTSPGQGPGVSKALILKNPAVQSSMQLHVAPNNQRKPLAPSPAAAAGSTPWSLGTPPAQLAAAAGSPFEGAAAGEAAGPSNQRPAAPVGAAGPQAAAAEAAATAAAAPSAVPSLSAALAQDADVAMLDAPALAATAAAEGLLGGCISREGSSLPGAAAEVAIAAAIAAAAAGPSTGSRSNSPTNQQTATAAAAAAPAQPMQQYQQQQQAMLPPLPVKVSSWEVAELPVLLQYLQEQVATGDYCGLDVSDLPAGVADPGYLLEQLEEAVAKAAEQEQQELAAAAARQDVPAALPAAAAAAAADGAQRQFLAQPAAAGGAAAHGRGPQLLRPRSLRELSDDAAAWQAVCGELHPEPLQPDTMRLAVEFTTALQQGFEVQRTLGWGEEQKMHEDTIEATVGETDPAVATNSRQTNSAGSYHSGAGTARRAREAAAGRGYQATARWPSTAGGRGAAGGAGGGGPAALAAAAAGAGAGMNRPAVTRGEQQAKTAKKTAVMKGIGLRAGKR